jgi:medium-chain acyl-[acyl-carrier-protein] hydrolase
VYRQKLTIMPSEVGCTGEIKMRALLNRLQDAAGLAVEHSEGSTGKLMKRGYAWVLLRYELKVEKRMPGIDETVLLETRHTPGDGFYTLRVFRVFDEKDEAETLVSAKTSWVLIDLAVGRPVRATQRLPEIFSDVADDPPIDGDFVSIPKLSGAKAGEEGPCVKEIKEIKGKSEKSFSVRFHDLDANGHVNNAVYFEWLWESTPLDLLDWSIRKVHAEFRVSVKLGETVSVKVEEREKESVGAIINSVEEGEALSKAGARFFVYDMVIAGDPKARPVARFCAVWTPLGPSLNGGGLLGALSRPMP